MGPKPPKPQPLPPAPQKEDPQTEAGARALLEEVVRRQRGRAATLLTGGLGAPGEAPVRKPTLLGS